MLSTRSFDTVLRQMKAISNRQSNLLRGHGPVLSRLWLSGITVSGLNFLSTLLIVSRTSPEEFAGYTLALSVMTIAGALADGGLAATFGSLAVASSGESATFQKYHRIYRRYAVMIMPVGITAAVLLAILVAIYSKVPLGRRPVMTLSAFVALGAGTAYTSQSAAFLHARGLFREYSKTLTIGAASRAAFICAAVFFFDDFDLRLLFILTAIPVGIATVFAARYTNSSTRMGSVDAPLAAEVRKFLLPTGVALVLNAVTFQVTALGGSFYAPSVVIGTYGVFMRASQIVAMLFTPAAAYGTRQIRLADSTYREHQETKLLVWLTAMYGLYAAVALGIYCYLGATFKHYTLGHTLEYAIFLGYCGLGSIQSWMDSILGARGYARHRIMGTIVLCSVNMALLPLVRPQTLRTLVCIDLASMVTIVIFYAHQLAAARRLTHSGMNDDVSMERRQAPSAKTQTGHSCAD